MRLTFARLRFAHRWLWERDETYRLAAVLGPPVLLGLALALGGIHEIAAIRAGTAPPWLIKLWALPASLPLSASPFHPSGASAPWAQPLPAGSLPQDGTPTPVAPTEAMPPEGPGPTLARLQPGWTGEVLPVQGRDDFGLEIGNVPQAALPLPGLSLDMGPLVAAAPADGRYVAAAAGILLVRTAGRYALSARVVRPAGAASATCLTRLGIGKAMALAEVDLAFGGNQSRTYEPAVVDLQPGFYRFGVAFGCWHDGRLTPQGSLTVLMRRPADKELTPLRAGEVYHQRR